MNNNSKKPLIGIIGGKGRMGEWFRAFFNSLGYKVLVSDTNTKFSNIDLAKRADIVIISVPIKKTVEVIKQIRDYVRTDALLCDLTSLKSEQVKAMTKAKSAVLGMHPLFGPLVQDLIGEKIVFCPVRNNKWTSFLKNVFESNKAEIIKISPKDHDFQMAIIQALAHFTNLSLARTFYSEKFIPNQAFLTPIFRLQSLIIGRVLGQNPKLYADIQIENPYFKKVLLCFEKQIKDLARDVKNKNTDEFIRKFKQTSLFLDDFIKVAEAKSTYVLKIMNEQPIGVKRLEKKIDLKDPKARIGFLGPKGTFSHQAVLKIFPNNKQLVPFTIIRDIFEAVNNQEIDFAVVPAENTLGGIVTETINSLIEYPLKVTGAFELEVEHCLLGRVFDKKDLKIIKSHKQAFLQCRDWLKNNLPNVKIEPSSSTTSAIKETKDKSVGFIASYSAAEVYGLNILARNIEDNKGNVTKFYLISTKIVKDIQKEFGAKKTLLLLAIYNRVGILRDILNIFANNNLNLCSMHSVPSRLQPWDYYFFLEIDTSYTSEPLEDAIKQIDKYCTIIRKIGVS